MNLERRIAEAVRDAMIAGGIEHGVCNVRQIPGGSFQIVAVPEQGSSSTRDEVSGGGSFGGGGATVRW